MFHGEVAHGRKKPKGEKNVKSQSPPLGGGIGFEARKGAGPLQLWVSDTLKKIQYPISALQQRGEGGFIPLKWEKKEGPTKGVPRLGSPQGASYSESGKRTLRRDYEEETWGRVIVWRFIGLC